MSIKEQFEILTGFFYREKLDFAIIGAFALHAYGYTRATTDVDFIARTDCQKKIVGYLESIGFETLSFSEGYSNHLHPIGNIRFDLVYVEGETARSIFQGATKKLILENLELPVVSPDHLILLKLFAIHNEPGRKFKELSDIQEICRRTNIDKTALLKYFKKYGLEEYYDEIIADKPKEK